MISRLWTARASQWRGRSSWWQSHQCLSPTKQRLEKLVLFWKNWPRGCRCGECPEASRSIGWPLKQKPTGLWKTKKAIHSLNRWIVVVVVEFCSMYCLNRYNIYRRYLGQYVIQYIVLCNKATKTKKYPCDLTRTCGVLLFSMAKTKSRKVL